MFAKLSTDIVVYIIAKRRCYQLSLHPSTDVYARYISMVAGLIVLTNHYIRWLPIWFAGPKPEPTWMLFMQFSLYLGLCLSFSSADVPSILNTD